MNLILSRPDINRYLAEGKLQFTPSVDEAQVGQVSINLRLGKKFTVPKDPPSYLQQIVVDSSIWASLDLWDHIESSTYLLRPGEFVLAQTLESVTMPNDLAGLVEGRSSWARLGITIHVTAPKIDPGFSGTITLEMSNLGKLPVQLRAEKDDPAQLILFQISTSLDKEDLYGANPKDIFQNQKNPIPGRPPAK